MIEEALRSILLASPSVSALVDSRIYHVLMPQSPTLPAITIQLISDGREYDLTGDTGERTAIYQICAWDNTPLGARAVAGAVVATLSGHVGTIGSIEMLSCTEVNRTHLYEPKTATHQEIAEFEIICREV